MSTQSKVQASESQLLRQQPQAIELQHSQTAQAKPEQHIRTTEAVITPPLAQIDTVALVQYGGITAAIILSLSVFILALAEYTKVFVPVMLQKPDEKTKPAFRRKAKSKI
jgi:hypothetical protein